MDTPDHYDNINYNAARQVGLVDEDNPSHALAAVCWAAREAISRGVPPVIAHASLYRESERPESREARELRMRVRAWHRERTWGLGADREL